MHYPPRFAVLAVLAVLLLACGLTRTYATTWTDVDIGSPTVAGSHTEGAGTVTITGAGTGDSTRGSDQLHYAYQTSAGGDIDIIARLSAFTGNVHARAGIMLRDSNNANATTANAVLIYLDSYGTKHNLADTGYDQTSNIGNSNIITTNMALPLWLRLVRQGQHFAVYKSPDGVLWSTLYVASGWKYIPTGSFEYGFFAAGGAAGTTCTATFDNINIAAPHLGYSTSWIGNSFSGNSLDGYVSNSICSLWTASDGTCYTNSYYDEGWAQAAKIYKDGKIVCAFNNGAFANGYLGGCSYEGSITGDGTKMYMGCDGYQGVHLAQCDKQASGNNTWPMLTTTDIWDSTKNCNIMSGMAVVGNKLYISNERDNNILVLQTDLPRYFQQTWSTVNTTATAVSTTGVTHAAPASVYQSQRQCGDALTYVVPNLTPNTRYTLRCHFAEYTETQTGQRLVDVDMNGATPVRNYDVVAAAGGAFKAAVLDIPNGLTDASGNLTFTFNPSNRHGGSGDGNCVICGFEVFITDGADVFALNCAGPATGSFQAEVCELASQDFAFTRPGPMVADSRGDLWIIQEANDFPIGTTMTTKYTGAVLCYHTNGTYAGKQITGVTNPAALAYDAVNDRLLIADNSVNQDIAIYNNLATTPTFQTSFGVAGGLYAGANPGLINDPASGGYARFYGITGVGIDSSGNIYVSCGLQGSDLRKYTSSGSLVWMVNGLPFCVTPSIDPGNENEAYASYWHASLNYNNTTPGSEWSYTGYNWNASLYGAPPRQASSQTIMRRIGGQKIMFTSAQGYGSGNTASIFRFNGEILVPCGSIYNNGASIWIDQNGDGVSQSGEVVNGAAAPGTLIRYSMDENGDIWYTLMGGTPILRHFRCKGLNSCGAPIYTLNSGDFEDITFPDPGVSYNMYGQVAGSHYDAVHDIMYLMGPANVRTKDADPMLNYLARYDAWSTGNRTPRWQVTLPDPTTNPNFPTETWYPFGVMYSWMGFDVAGTNIYLAEIWGPVHVFNADTGAMTQILNPGPVVDGWSAWEDAAMGLTAYQRSTGETIIFTENSGCDARCNMYRVPAGTTCMAPTCSPWAGTYATSTTVTLAPVTSGSTIRYTTDGSTPSETNGTIYSSPITFTSSGTLKAIAYKAGLSDSVLTTCVYTIQCAAPIFTPAAGTYATAQNVTINCATPGTTIRYTTDGTTPTETTGTIYTGPVTISNFSTTLQAIAYKSGLADSPVTSGVYSIIYGTPLAATLQYQDGWVASPSNCWANDNYPSSIIISNDTPLSTGPEGYDNRGIYWFSLDLGSPQTVNTVKFWNYFRNNGCEQGRSFRQISIWVSNTAAADGSNGETNVSTANPTPTVPQQLLNQSNGSSALTVIPVPGNPTGRYVLVRLFGTYANPNGLGTSGDYEGLCGIEVLGSAPAVATPTFTPAAGTYTSSQTVTISSTTGGATIRYTTDGTTPSETVGTVYSTPVAISSTCTLQAIAYKSGMADSAVASGAYVINLPSGPLPATIQYQDGWIAAPTNGWGGGTYSNALITTTDTPLSASQQTYDNRGTFWISLDLGSSQVVNTVKFWNYYVSGYGPFNASRCYRQIAIWVTDLAAADGSNGATNVSTTYPTPNVPLQLLTQTQAGDTAPALTTIPVPGSPTGRYVLLELFGTYGNPTGLGTTNDYEGFNGVEIVGGISAVATPSFSPTAGTYTSAQTVTISTTTGGASIRYTTDGTTPSETVGTVYSGPVTISSTCTLQAIAYKSGMADSAVASGAYTINASNTPVYQINAGGSAVAPFAADTYYTGGSAYTPPDGTIDTSAPNAAPAAVYKTQRCVGGVGNAFSYAFPSLTPNGNYSVRLHFCEGNDNAPGVRLFDVTINGSTVLSNFDIFATAGAMNKAVVETFAATADATGTITIAFTPRTCSDAWAIVNGLEILTSSAPVATPTFSPGAGTYNSAQTVTISTTTSGASIRYTTDGTTPSDTVGTVYSSPVSISANTTLQAIAYKSGMANSSVASGVYNIQCAAPAFSPVAGTFTTSTSVTITTGTSGASIRYTTDGTTPTSTVGTIYSTPVTISQNTTLQALAYKSGMADSSITSGAYTIQCAAPSYSPAAGTYTTSTSVTISTTTSGASIRYTTDGTTPSSTVGTVYSSAVSLTASCTLKAIAYKSGLADSPVTSGTYTIQCAAPSFSPAAGTYTTSTSVTITSSTSGATIRYTTDGTTPSSTVGTVYSSAVSLTASCTLKAIAYKSGMADSTVTSGTYTIQCAAPSFSPAAGSYSTAQSVTITSSTSGVTIRYTTDGTTPSSTVGTVYSSPVSISSTTTLKAIAYKTGLSNSSVTSGTYTIYTGTTTVGSTNTAISANMMRGTRFQAGANMTVTKINLNIGTSVSGNIQCAIYTDNAGVPGTLLMGTNALSNPGTGWKTFTLTSSQALTNGTYYWIMCWSAANYSVKCNTSSGGSWYRSLTYGTWPSSAGSGTTETRTWSIYAY